MVDVPHSLPLEDIFTPTKFPGGRVQVKPPLLCFSVSNYNLPILTDLPPRAAAGKTEKENSRKVDLETRKKKEGKKNGNFGV